MTEEEMRELVKECGLDWKHGYVPLFDGDPTNRFAVLIEAVEASTRVRLAGEIVAPKPDGRARIAWWMVFAEIGAAMLTEVDGRRLMCRRTVSGFDLIELG